MILSAIHIIFLTFINHEFLMDEYLPVRLNTLKAERCFIFDVYIKLPRRYLLYVKNGGVLLEDQYKRLKSKKIRKLFIRPDEEKKYQEFLDNSLNALMNDKQVSKEDKAQFISGVTEDSAEKVYEKPNERFSYNEAIKASQLLLKNLQGANDILKKPEKDFTIREKLQYHAANTAALAVRFGEFLQINDKDREILGVASLYHNVGLKHVSDKAFSYVFKDLAQVDYSDALKEYKSHPQKACEELQGSDFIDDTVLELILTHEERIDGSGFPRKLKKLKNLEEVHAIVCFFEREVSLLNKDPKNVLDDLLLQNTGKFNLEMIKKFKKFLSFIKD